MKINLNQVAQEITVAEGMKESLSIAQVKEVLRILLTEYSLEELVRMWFQKNK